MKKEIKWLLSELPILLEKNLISEDSADKIETYYSIKLKEEYQKSGRNIFTIITILGSILIGLGFILLSAYNWELMSRELKVASAIVPLVTIQGVILFGKIKEFKSKLFVEVTGILLALLIGGSMAIISQAYQIQGDIRSFLQVWMILIIPMVYILRSNMIGLIYFILTIVWTSIVQIDGGSGSLFWLFGALILPYYYFYIIKKERFSNSSFFFNLAFVIWLLTSVGIALEKAVPGLWIIIYSLIFVILYYLGITLFDKSGPFHFIGKYGAVYLSYLFTFKFFWEDIGFYNFRTDAKFNNLGIFSDYIILTALLGYFVYICITNFEVIAEELGIFSFLPVISVAAFFLGSSGDSTLLLIAFIFNIFTLILGILSINSGFKNRNFVETNMGMAVVGLLIMTRFLDLDFGFIEKAVSFIVLGAIFISVNFFIKIKTGENNE